jgi:NAD(P)-dependent dehydrogenase (short-subunit alcohol dehydrogenase family)
MVSGRAARMAASVWRERERGLFDLNGRTALITGASRGLGQMFGRALANAGADLVVTSRRIDVLTPFCHEIEELGRKALPLELDVRDQYSIERMCAAALAAFEKIDILVNNAGCNIRKPALQVTWEDWNTILDTNLRGTFFVAQGVGRHMVERRYGRIINIGSYTSVAGFAGLAPYGASRGGVKQLTMSLADDWGPFGVTVNCLAPGWFKTDLTRVLFDTPGWGDYINERIPVRRPGEPEDLEGAIVFLASEVSRYVTGQTILVDGGLSTGAMRVPLKT